MFRDLKALLLSLGYAVSETEQGLLVAEHNDDPRFQTYENLPRLQRMAVKSIAKEVLEKYTQ